MTAQELLAENRRLTARIAEVASVAEERGYEVQHLRAGIEALADEWDKPGDWRVDDRAKPANRRECATALRALLAGGGA